MSVIQIMAQRKSAEATSSSLPTLPRKTYTRSFSTDTLPSNPGLAQSSEVKKPPPVPRTAVIKSASAVHMKLNRTDISVQEAESVANKPPAIPATVSRSFSFESGGVRRKIPVTPSVSTSGHKRHETAHYRHGTLVSPSEGPIFAVLAIPADASAASRPTVKNKTKTTKDPVILKFCQDADLAGLIAFLQSTDEISSEIVNFSDPSGKTGLAIASSTGNVGVVRELLKLPSLDINCADNEGNTALHLASQAGHADVVSLLTLNPTLMIDSRNLAGLTPLMKAALQGRIRCTRILLLAGASPVLRDFGRGMCAMEWAQYCNRSKCAEIIEKYMEKMQLNPGLGMAGFNNPNRWTSEPDLKTPHVILASAKKESWVRSTLKKAIQVVSGGNHGNSPARPFNVASQLTNAVICASMPILPNSSRRSSLAEAKNSSSTALPTFSVPKIQVTYWNNALGVIPPPPTTAPPLPPGSGAAGPPPQAPSRSRQVRSRSNTSPMPSREELSQQLKMNGAAKKSK